MDISALLTKIPCKFWLSFASVAWFTNTHPLGIKTVITIWPTRQKAVSIQEVEKVSDAWPAWRRVGGWCAKRACGPHALKYGVVQRWFLKFQLPFTKPHHHFNVQQYIVLCPPEDDIVNFWLCCVNGLTSKTRIEFNDDCFKQMEKFEAIVSRERTAILIRIVNCFVSAALYVRGHVDMMSAQGGGR